MKTKLTLTIDHNVISSAKSYARQNGKTLSGIVENYLKSISKQEVATDSRSPKVAKLKGVIILPVDFDYKKELSNILVNKFC